jgi:pimeloyl-ACP methyl ester carboxylesterase
MPAAPIYKTEEGQRTIMAYYDRILATWPVPHDEFYVETRQGRTFVIASGDPALPPVVLLHGASSNALSWIADVPQIAACLRVYAVDRPGEPGRSDPYRAPYEGPAHVEWLSDLFAGLGLASASLVGISQGGWNALKFATAAPERLPRLVLLAPGGVTMPRPSFLLRAIPLTFFGQRGAEALNRVVTGDVPMDPDALAYMNVIMTHYKPRVGSSPTFTDDELRRLTMPVLLIVGARDTLLPSEKTVARLGAVLPNLTTIMLPDQGHVLHAHAGAMVEFLVR